MFNEVIHKQAHTSILKYSSSQAASISLQNTYNYSEEEADHAVMEVIMTMIAGAPLELRSSIEMVISWWRWNDIYEMSKQKNNVVQMTFAQNNMDNLLRGLHS